MKARTPLLSSLIAAVSLVPAVESVAAPAPAADRAAVLELDGLGPGVPAGLPWVSGRLTGSLKRRLAAALVVAARRIREVPSCRALFADLGADGLQALLASYYRPATQQEERIECAGSAALTTVGGRVTRLCRAFGGQPTAHSAVVLIHEALHHAGLTEYPADPEAMTSAEINGVVAASCAF